MNADSSSSTQTQLLVYIASMLLRMQAEHRQLQHRLNLAEAADASQAAIYKKWFSTETAHRQAQLELEGFAEQFPELARFAEEYSAISDGHFAEALNEAVNGKRDTAAND